MLVGDFDQRLQQISAEKETLLEEKQVRSSCVILFINPSISLLAAFPANI